MVRTGLLMFGFINLCIGYLYRVCTVRAAEK